MMSFPLELPPLLRLALEYAPPQARAQFAALFVCDQQMARVIAGQSEPLIAQIKLAWWRDLFADSGSTRAGDATFKFIVTAWAGRVEEFSAVVDGWEEMLAGAPDFGVVAAGRAAPFVTLASRLGCGAEVLEKTRICATRWALMDIHDHLSKPAERGDARQLAAELPLHDLPLPRILRPLAVLDGVARRALTRGGGSLIGDRLSPLAAIRLGIFGR